MISLLFFSALIIMFTFFIGVKIILVRQIAFRDNLKQAPVFGDLLHIVTWDPNEGVSYLHNKELQQSVRKRRRSGFKVGGAWQSSMLPVTSAHEALAKEIEIRSLANLIGIEATTINELLKNFRGASVLGQIPFIDVLEKRASNGLHDDSDDGSKIKIRKRGDSEK